MKAYYVVVLLDLLGEIEITTLCKGDGELGNLILHLDRTNYSIKDIINLGDQVEVDYKKFLVSDSSLEIGKGENNVN